MTLEIKICGLKTPEAVATALREDTDGKVLPVLVDIKELPEPPGIVIVDGFVWQLSFRARSFEEVADLFGNVTRVAFSNVRTNTTPDPSTFRVLPWEERGGQGKVARLICDITHPDGRPFEGCCRTILRNQVKEAKKLGYERDVPEDDDDLNRSILEMLSEKCVGRVVFGVAFYHGLELLDRVGLADVGDRAVGKYSTGMRARLIIARALLGSPQYPHAAA